MTKRLLVGAAVLGCFACQSAALADTLVSTINGYYDVDGYDTPSLHILNSTASPFTSVQLKLTGYQGLNNGVSQSVSLADIAPGETRKLVWGSIPGASGSLFAYDYDDEYGHAYVFGQGLDQNHNMVAAPQCGAVGDYNLCSQVGNFYVTFTAMWNGQAIYSQFSPDNTLPGAGNAAGMFVGWLGLDPNGWSETTYDSHSNGGPSGVLANIYVGVPPTVGGTPEPGTIALVVSGLAGVAILKRRSVRASKS